MVVERNEIVHGLTTALQGSVDIRSRSRVLDQLVAPVGADTILVYQVADIIVYRLANHVAELDVLLRVHHLLALAGSRRDTILCLYGELNRLVVLSLLGSDNNYTVSST